MRQKLIFLACGEDKTLPCFPVLKEVQAVMVPALKSITMKPAHTKAHFY
jgi:hypothetical protein